MIVVHETLTSDDDVIKYIVSSSNHPELGKNEVSIIEKNNKWVICMPTQTNCDLGCKFCHLTGTTRPTKKLTYEFMYDVIIHCINEIFTWSCDMDKELLISFMGAGEPLCNVEDVITTCNMVSSAHFGDVRFAIATTVPNLSNLIRFGMLVNAHKLRMKIHLSLHGIDTRKELMHDHVTAEECIDQLNKYKYVTGNPIEYHYSLIDGVNDSWEEIAKLCNMVDVGDTIKFLTLNPINDLALSKRELEVKRFFNKTKHTVEYYTPPGRDIGSSCGQFNISLYNTEGE